MDLIIIILLIALVAVFYRDIKFVTYAITAVEVFLRIIHYIGDNIHFISLNKFINKIFPDSLFSMFSNYTSGIIYDIISWTLILSFIIFLYYLVMYFIRKK